MIDKLNEHYSMTNPATVHDEEALSTLELVGRTTAKVNEVVASQNKVREDTDNMIKVGMPEAVDKEVDNHIKNGDFDNQIDEFVGGLREENAGFKTAVTNQVSTKVDKNGNEQITLKNLSQEVKTAMTGGSVAVVGDNAVNTSNIVNDSVTGSKLSPNLRKVMYYYQSPVSRFVPVLEFTYDDTSKTCIIPDAIKNLTHTMSFVLNDSKSTNRYEINGSDLKCDTTKWNQSFAFRLYLNVTTNTIFVTNYFLQDSALNECLYLGGLGSYDSNGETHSGAVNDLVIPISINGEVYSSGGLPTAHEFPKEFQRFIGRAAIYDRPFFDYDFATATATLYENRVNHNLVYNSAILRLKLETSITVNASPSDKTVFVYYNQHKNQIIINSTLMENDVSLYFLGWLSDIGEWTAFSTCSLPCTINNTYFISDTFDGAEWSRMGINDGGYCTLDIVNRKLKLPENKSVYIECAKGFCTFNPTIREIDIPLFKYCYFLSDGAEIYCVAYDDFRVQDLKKNKNTKYRYYLGCVYMPETGATKENVINNINMPFEVDAPSPSAPSSGESAPMFPAGKTVSILGDSISTYEGWNPDGNAVYYNGSNCGVTSVNQTWWKRVIDKLGLELLVNESWSGSQVTPIFDIVGDNFDEMDEHNPISGFTRCMNLSKDGANPDIILVYMGINDFKNNVVKGNDYTGLQPAKGSCYLEDLNCFERAFDWMLYKLVKNYPQSKIYVLTLPPTNYFPNNGDVAEFNTFNTYLKEFNDVIKYYASFYGVEIIDTDRCGITIHNGSNYMGDYDSSDDSFLHPNASGHKLIADKVIKKLAYSEEG